MAGLRDLRNRAVDLRRKAHDLFSGLFYRHGLFCASHPYVVLFFSFSLMFFLSYPIVTQLHTNLREREPSEPIQFWETTSSRTPVDQESFSEKYGSEPFLHLEQIVINVNLSDFKEGGDRGVLDRRLLKYALDIQERMSQAVAMFTEEGYIGTTAYARRYALDDICYKPYGRNNCLIHSPLEYWGSDPTRFLNDDDYFSTLSNASVVSSLGIPIPLHSVFGGIMLDSTTGTLKSAQSMVITYFLTERNHTSPIRETVSDVWDKLWESVFPPSSQMDASNIVDGLPNPLSWRANGEVKHIFYEFARSTTLLNGESLVLSVMYLIVFLYISLVLGKVDLVKSKFALGFGAVVTVFSGLIMSVGLCSMLGVKTSLVPWEVLPFLIIMVGVENIFVLTNAVVTTSMDLPVKERVGLGLGKVGVSMSLSLGGEMCLLLISSTMSIPALQDFCLFGAVSIVMDYLMQITFFITILSIDIRRLELSELHKLRTIQNGLNGRRSSISAAATANMDDGSTQTENDGSVRSRPHWGGYLMILVTICFLGFGLFGSSPSAVLGNSEAPIGSFASSRLSSLTPAANGTFCQNSMCATADAFWHVIDPDRSAKYVEIRPPTYVGFGVTNGETGAPSSGGVDAKTIRFRDRRTATLPSSLPRRFMEGAHPAVFTCTVVFLLLFGTLLCVMCTSLALWFSRLDVRVREMYANVRSSAPKAAQEVSTWNPKIPDKITSLWSGSSEDVQSVMFARGMVTWLGGDEKTRCWTNAERVLPRRRRGRRKYGRDTCYAVYKGYNDEEAIACGTDTGLIYVWSPRSDDVLFHHTSPCCDTGVSVTRILWRSIWKIPILCAGMSDGCIVVLTWDSGSSLHTERPSEPVCCRLKGHTGRINDMQLDMHGSLLTTSDDGTARCWTMQSTHGPCLEWCLTAVFNGHRGAISSLAFDSETGILATGGTHGEIFLWNVEAKKPLGSILAGSADAPIKKNDPGYGVTLNAVFLHRTQWAENTGKYMLCSAGNDQCVRIWEVTLTLKSEEGPLTPSITRNRSLSAPTTAIPTPRDLTVRRESFVCRDAGILNVNHAPVGNVSSDVKATRCASDVSSINVRYMGVIQQPGCVTAVMEGSMLIGARTVSHSGEPQSHRTVLDKRLPFGGVIKRFFGSSGGNGAAAERRSRVGCEGNASDWWWELWIVNLADPKDPTRIFRTVKLGKDELRGLGCRPRHPIQESEISTERCSSQLMMGQGVYRPSAAGLLQRSRRPKASRRSTHEDLNRVHDLSLQRPDREITKRYRADSKLDCQSRSGEDQELSLSQDVNGCRRPSQIQTPFASATPPAAVQIEKTAIYTSEAGRSPCNGPVQSNLPQCSDSEDLSLESSDDDRAESASAISDSTLESEESTCSSSGPSPSYTDSSSDGEQLGEEQLPVLQIRSLAACEEGITVGFGNYVKVITFDGRAEEKAGEGHRFRNGWLNHSGSAPGKVHVA
ncbi:hypothetical protein, variant [Spizellomyces punctatus DAOM BR117]|uniref:Sterol regulatory element-binding protein cleavage-activating protein n=1 Tax=Spizellomyces punctatus (strain DAOM BR117) TaxID=645134 RepID=A0A0L0HI53_SPIPD|nr:hypothetical protein, variant [Spizellomyces punctatus DAOM BR117]KND00509.1 hypothetical protein, variant [Spizellomyces punctatus DAOM BR117]|eukprot:XP_016608548.1 hypothetical protein, variant [Spizellomyces punctatus DAOM BR117]